MYHNYKCVGITNSVADETGSTDKHIDTTLTSQCEPSWGFSCTTLLGI